jgi:hypothetical protein
MLYGACTAKLRSEVVRRQTILDGILSARVTLIYE